MCEVRLVHTGLGSSYRIANVLHSPTPPAGLLAVLQPRPRTEAHLPSLVERRRNGLAPVAPDPYDILFITDRTQKPVVLRTTITIDTRLRTNFGVFLSGTSQQGGWVKRNTTV
jgi:hypothetical protein